jgi:rare lipoprotein A
MICLSILCLIAACAPARPRPVPGLPPAYKVLGSWYQPLAHADGFTQKGIASWYGPTFHGKKTANGEIYDMHAMTAAHTTLPLGTWVRVRNRANGKEVTVRINDRGPFVHGRIIDLSKAAADALDLIGHGTGKVQVTALTGPPKTTKPAAAKTPKTYTLQVGSFDQKANAEALVRRLSADHAPVHLISESGTFKVRVGRFTDRNAAEAAKIRLADAGFAPFTVLTD